MKLRALAFGSTALAAALAAGCFATNPDPWNLPPDQPPDTPPVIGNSLYVDDLAVDPATGNLVSLEYATNGYGQIIVVRDPVDFEAIASVALPENTYAMSISSPNADNQVFISDGSFGNYLVDLDTGAYTPVSGMDAVGSGPPAFMATGKFDDDDSDETFSVPCEFGPGDDMLVFDGDGDDRVLLARVGLASSGLSGVTDLTMASPRGIVFALGYEGPVGLDAATGARVYEFNNGWTGDLQTWAYDPVNDRIITVDYSGNLGAIDLE